MTSMRCGGCGVENREGAKFCGDCGSRLERRCGHCDVPLTLGVKFCDECGTPVGEVGAATEPVAGAAARKSVTVAFVDLGGSTAFGEAVDAETARTVMGRYHSLVTEAVETHGGTVAKYIGDGVMVLFGVPEVAEDDAVRAVAFGADVQERFAPFAERVATRHGSTVTLRVGVNTGEIVVGEDDVDLYGDALNVAARLEKACPHGGVLVGEETWRLARNEFAFEAQGEVEVHGRSGAVRPYLLILDAEVEEQTAPFVGRDGELARLGRLFTRTVADRRPALASVVGPAGVGKTRLSRELHTLVGTDDVSVYTATCDRHGEATFGPIADLLRPDDVAGPDAVRAGLLELLDGDADAGRVVEGLLAVLGSAAKKVSVEETFWAVRRLVERLGRDGPVVVVVDDIQWASEQLLDLFEHLVSFVDDTALMLVTLARPEIRELRPAFAETGRLVDELVLLTGLDADATAHLAARLLGTAELPRGLAERLPASTDGNPLFVREVVRMLVDEQVIRADGDGWVLTVDPDAIDVPPTIQSLLAARVERLPPEERAVLERASVIGPDFTRGGLDHLCTPVERTALPQVLRSLTRRELIEATGAYWGDDPVHRFHHVLIRDAVYRRLLKEVRADLHERVGNWMVDASAGVLGDHEAAIGHHFEQAFHYRADLGGDGAELGELADRAAHLLSAAAVVALRDDDTVAASGLARRALGCLAADAPARPAALTLACEASLDLGDTVAAQPFIDELLALAELSPAFAGWAKAYDAQSITIAEPDRLADAETIATEAVRAMAELDDPAGRAKARLVRAAILARRGRIGECEAELDVALTEARAARDTRRVVAVLGVAPLAALWGPSPVARAGGRCLDVLRLLRITASSPSVEAVALRCQAVLEALRGRVDTALTLIDRAQHTIEELGLHRELADIAMARGQIHLLADDPAAAEAPLRKALEELHTIHAGAEASQAAALLGRALVRLDRTDEVESLVDEAERLAGENLKAAILGRTVRAEWLLASGRRDEARTVAERAVAIAATTDLVLDHAEAADVLGHFDADAARRAVELREIKGVRSHLPTATADSESSADAEPSLARPAAVRAIAGDQDVPDWIEAVFHRTRAAWNEGDFAAFAAAFTDDTVVDSARSVGAHPTRGADALQAMWGMQEVLPRLDTDIEFASDLGLVLTSARFHDASGNEVLMLPVFEFDEARLMERTTTFDGHDRAGAEALYRQRLAERASRSDDPFDRIEFVVPDLRRVVENTPYGDLVAAVTTAWATGDDDRLAWIYGRDDVVVDNRKSTVNSGTIIGQDAAVMMQTTRAFFPVVDRVEILAVRGARHGVSRGAYSGDDAVEEFLLVGEADRDGCIVRQVVLDDDAIADAITLVDEWYLTSDEAVGRDVVRVGTEIMELMHDPARHAELRDRTADDVVARHPPALGDQELDRDGFLEFTAAFVGALVEVVESWDYWVVWSEPRSETVASAVVRRTARMLDGTSGEWLWASANEYRDGQLRRLHLEEVEALHDARRAAQEFNGYGAFGSSPDALADVAFVDPPEWNEAVRWRLRTIAFFNDLNRDPTIQLVRGDAQIHDRRPLFRSEFVGQDEVLAFSRALLQAVDEQVSSGSIPRDPFRLSGVLDVVGDRLCLTAEFIAGVVDTLFLVEIDEEGLLLRTATFEPEQLDEARTTLDQWHVEQPAAPTEDPLLHYQVVVPELRRLADGTPFAEMGRMQFLAWHGDDHLRARLYGRDDLQLDDRRSVVNLGAGAGSATHNAVEDFAAIYTRWVDAEVLAVRGTRFGATRVTFSDDDGNEYPVIAVDEADSEGRVVRSTYFDSDRIMEAVALLDEWYLEADEAIGMEVVTVGSRLLASQHDPSQRDAVRRALADDVVIRFADELASWGEISRDDYLEINDTLTEEAVRIHHWVVWGEPLSASVGLWVGRRVVEMSDGTNPEWLVAIVGEVRDDQVRSIEVFRIEDLDRARAHARVRNGLGAFGEAPAVLADAPTIEWPDWNSAVRARLAINHFTNGLGPGIPISPDAVLDDHRPLNRAHAEGPAAIAEFAFALRETVLASIDAGSSPPDPFRQCRVLAIDGDHRCLTADCVVGVADYLTVGEVDSAGVVTRQAYYEPEQLDEALADFRSAATTQSPEDPLELVDFVVPALRASIESSIVGRSMATFIRSWYAGPEQVAWYFGRDELVLDGRLSTVNSGTNTGDDAVALGLATHEFFPDVVSCEVVAVRGPRLSALRYTLGDDAGNRYTFIAVTEAGDDGRIVRLVSFDEHAITEAVEQLDQWYVTSPDAVEPQLISAGSSILHSMGDPTRRDELLGRLQDDVVFRMASGSSLLDDLDREAFLASQDALIEQADRLDFWTVWGEPHSPDVSISVLRRLATMRDGSTAEWLVATANVFRDGRLLLCENFDIDDLERARRRAAELAALDADDESRGSAESALRAVRHHRIATTHPGGTPHVATEFPGETQPLALRQVNDHLRYVHDERAAGVRDARVVGPLRERFAPKFHRVDHRPLGTDVLDAEEAERSTQILADLGFVMAGVIPVAGRGEHHTLGIASVQSDDNEMLSGVGQQYQPDGLLSLFDVFAPSDVLGAYHRMLDRYLADEDDDAEAGWVAIDRAFVDALAAGDRSALRATFVHDLHAILADGTELGADAYVDAHLDFRAGVPGAKTWIGQMRTEGDRALVELVTADLTVGLEGLEWFQYVIWERSGGRIVSAEHHVDVHGALARFDHDRPVAR